MSFSISDVSYAYPIAPTIGTDDIAKVTISGDSIEAICEAYNNLFSNYAYKLYGKNDEDKKNLQHYVGTILGKQNFSLDDEIKDIEEFIADIFDKDGILSKNSNAYTECKEGLKAYKFYLKEVLTNLYNLKQAIEDAQNTIGILYTLECATEEELNNVAHKLITDLQCYDKQAQDLIKAFTEYSVIKTLNVTKCITYNDGESDHLKEQTDQRTYDCIETEYRSFEKLIDRTQSLNNIGWYKSPEWIKDKEQKEADEKANQPHWLSDLEKQEWIDWKKWMYADYDSKTLSEAAKKSLYYGIQPEKPTVIRTYTTSYYKTDPITGQATEQLTDKYDLLACIKTKTTESVIPGNTSELALFDELTLLEKLQYIRIYYSGTKNTRYVFPEDNEIGYPCIIKQESKDALNDTKEIGQVEMFYLGYVVNRDGPINALASFLEIKVTAIKSQIKVLMERIKAIKAYSTLLQKGFEQYSKSAADYGASTRDSIPKAAFYIYRYLSTSATRCFYYIGNEPYIIVQYSFANTGEFCKDAGKGTDSLSKDEWNESPSGYYILVKPTEEGFNSFVDFLNKIPPVDPGGGGENLDSHKRLLDILFTPPQSKPSYEDNRFSYKYEPTDNRYYHPFLINQISDTKVVYKVRLDVRFEDDKPATTWISWTDPEKKFENEDDHWYYYWTKNEQSIKADGTNVRFRKIDKGDLPKKLDVSKIAGTKMTEVYYNSTAKFAWNDLIPDSNAGVEKKAVLPGFLSMWQSNYETLIANYKTNLEQQEKEITTLQKKIQTFDVTSTNFRNKAFTVYNKIVNKIK